MSDESQSFWLQLDQASRAVMECQAEYNEKHTEAEAAHRIVTDALNRLNQAQKRFDDTVAQVRAKAPHASDWNRSP